MKTLNKARSRTFLSTAATACLLCTPVSAAISLLTNGGNDLALVGGEISGWTEVSGTTWTQRNTQPTSQAGSDYFVAGNNGTSSPTAYTGELAQTVDLSTYASSIDAGTQQFDFSGWVSGWSNSAGSNSDTDTAQIIIEFLDAGSTVLDSYDSGAASYNYQATGWTNLTDSRFAVTGTRQVKVRLLAVRNNGTNNDGYFDSLELTTTPVPEPTSTALFGLGAFSLMLRRKRN